MRVRNTQSALLFMQDLPPMPVERLCGAPQASMSFRAQRIVNCANEWRLSMMYPERSPRFDERLFTLGCLLRVYAIDYIEAATQDADLMAWISEEAACGRRHSEQNARRIFCQAGVVAPPDSLMDEKKRVSA